MSLEAFCARFPADPIAKDIVIEERARRNRSGRSLIGVLAEEIAAAGGSGFKVLTSPLSRDSVGTVPDMRLLQRLSPAVRDDAFVHIAAVVFGISVVCIEDTLMNMQFDATDWSTRYNLTTSGTIVPRLQVSGSPLENIPEERWKRMIGLAGRDKTLVSFFKDGMDLMPESLRRILDRANTSVRMQSKIISMFEERAKFLIE